MIKNQKESLSIKTDELEGIFYNNEESEQVKDIVNWFVKTYAQIKLFSLEHSNVEKFVDILYYKLTQFFENNLKFTLDIEEDSFLFQGKPVYKDEQLVKSLPFLFYKDGMQALYFYKGLKKEELLDFLDIIKTVANLPPEKTDVVTVIWDKDFANIRYYAPDDFLETKIGSGIKPQIYKADKEKFITGTIELTQEDKSALKKYQLAKKPIDNIQIDQEVFDHEGSLLESLSKSITLNPSEMKTLESMIKENRKHSKEEEVTHLFIEILYLEDRIDPFSNTLNVLDQYLNEFIKKGDFRKATQILSHVLELKEYFMQKSSQKILFIDKFLANLEERKAIDSLTVTLLSIPEWDYDDFFDYITLIGPQAAPLVGNLFEEKKDLHFRKRAVLFLEEVCKKDISALMKIAHDKRETLTKEIISIISTQKENKVISYLVSFLKYKSKSIRLHTIKALGKFKDPKANKIILAFLEDKDKDIRTLAAQSLVCPEDPSALKEIQRLAIHKNFKKKSMQEKKSLLKFLGKSSTDESFAILQKFIKQSHFFSGRKTVETSLCAISALKNSGTQEAISILNEGTHMGNRKVRKACEQALKDIKKDVYKEESSHGK
ncbi:MAG: HEAT repeat domain-containing protein [Acidobacteriota bacterium]|nr:HEAT repeat domain-containing protein [Acidobacteriota bacterium]